METDNSVAHLYYGNLATLPVNNYLYNKSIERTRRSTKPRTSRVRDGDHAAGGSILLGPNAKAGPFRGSDGNHVVGDPPWLGTDDRVPMCTDYSVRPSRAPQKRNLCLESLVPADECRYHLL